MWESDRFSSHPNKLLGVRNLCEVCDLDSQTKMKTGEDDDSYLGTVSQVQEGGNYHPTSRTLQNPLLSEHSELCRATAPLSVIPG